MQQDSLQHKLKNRHIQTCGANPLPIFIPCHRVVAKGQALGGFNLSTTEFYLGIKRNLLIHENCY